MKNEGFIYLELLKWNEHIKRKDYQVKKWWAFDVDCLTHPDFFHIPGDYFKVYCWIMSIANKIGKNSLTLDISHTEKILNLERKVILDAVLYLDGKRWEKRFVPDPLRERTVSLPRIDKIRLEEIRKEENRLILSGEVKTSRGPTSTTFSISSEIEFNNAIPQEVKDRWLKLYDKEYVDREVLKAIGWAVNNPRKNKRTLKGWIAFLSNWFERGWDKHLKTVSTVKSKNDWEVSI